MSLEEIEIAITKLSQRDLVRLASWFADYHARAWDRQIEDDLRSGRLDELLKEVDAEIDAGKAEPL